MVIQVQAGSRHVAWGIKGIKRNWIKTETESGAECGMRYWEDKKKDMETGVGEKRSEERKNNGWGQSRRGW